MCTYVQRAEAEYVNSGLDVLVHYTAELGPVCGVCVCVTYRNRISQIKTCKHLSLSPSSSLNAITHHIIHTHYVFCIHIGGIVVYMESCSHHKQSIQRKAVALQFIHVFTV